MKYLMYGLLAGLLAGCNAGSTDKEVTETVKQVPSDSYVTTDDNSTIAIPKGSSTSIISTGDNEYFIYCPEGDCPVSMLTDSQNSTSSDINNTKSDTNSTVVNNDINES